MKTKTKSHNIEVIKFYDKKLDFNSKLDSNHTCLAVISLDSARERKMRIIIHKCPQVWEKSKKVIRHINDNLSDFPSSDESDKE